MARVTEKQLDELRDRHRLPSTDSRHVSRELLQAFLDARLMETFGAAPRLFDLWPFVAAMVKAGYPQACGMTSEAYTKLWPQVAKQPAEYAGRFDAVLLVDRSIAIPKLVQCGNLLQGLDSAACNDLTPRDAPQHPKTKAPLARYVAWVQLGQRNLGRTLEACCADFAVDEVGLVTVEGLHLPVQHQPHLRRWVVDLAGSRFSEIHAPYVSWFSDDWPYFYTNDVHHARLLCGSGSRGRQVIPVS